MHLLFSGFQNNHVFGLYVSTENVETTAVSISSHSLLDQVTVSLQHKLFTFLFYMFVQSSVLQDRVVFQINHYYRL